LYPSVSVIVPAFNEERRLPRSVPALLGLARTEGVELILVDDGSSDATRRVAFAELGRCDSFRLVSLPRHLGKGAAVRAGVARARGDAIAFMDADLATDVSALSSLLAALRDSDVAVGSRALPGSVVEAARWHRTYGGRLFNGVTRSLTGLTFDDTQCGFKAFRAPAARALFQRCRIDGFAFDVEILAIARSLGLRVTEVPVRWFDMNGSHVRPIRDPVIMLRDVAVVATRWRHDRSSSGRGSVPRERAEQNDRVAV
jgi:glycosyltransferase involved in cell wall biosynthesis